MASTDSRPVPIKNTAYRLYAPLLDADGDLVSSAAGLDSEVSLDGAAFGDCTNEWTEIGTTGVGYLDLTSSEMNADAVVVQIKTSTSGGKTTVVVLYPQESGDIKVDVQSFGGSAGTFASGRPEVNTTHIAGSAVSTSTAQLGVNVVNFGGSAGTFASGIPAVNATQISGDGTAADNLESAFDDTVGANRWTGILDQGTAQAVTGTTIRLRSAATFADSELNGCWVVITGATLGTGQVRQITAYASSTDTCTVDTWTTTPTGTITYQVLPGAMLAADVTKFGGTAATTSAGRPEVNTTHAAGTAWGSGAITAASIASNAITSAKIATDAIGAAQIADNAIDAGAIATDAITATKIATGAITSAKFAAGAITATVIATDAIDADALAADAIAEINTTVDAALVDIHLDHLLAATYDPASKPGASDALLNELVESDGGVARYTANALEQGPGGGSAPTAGEIADAVWDELLAGHVISGSAGDTLGNVATGTPPTAAAIADAVWDEAQSGHVGAGSFGEIATEIADILVDTSTTLQAELDGIQADTEDIQSRLPAALVSGRIDSSVSAAGLATDAAQEVATALLDLTDGIETSITLRQALRLILAAEAGKLSGAATTTITIRNAGDTKNRITATVDASGNRTAVTTDAT